MAEIADLLARVEHRGWRVLVAPEVTTRTISRLLVVDHLAELAGRADGALVVVLPSAIRGVEPYEMDVAIRRAVESGYAGVVLPGVTTVPITTAQLALRGGLAVLVAAESENAADLILWLSRIIEGGSADVLARVEAAQELLTQASLESGTQDLVAAINGVLGEQITMLETDFRPGPGAVLIGDRQVAELVCRDQDRAARVVLPAVAAALSQRLRHELEQAFAPALTRAELLVQLIVAEDAHLASLSEQARRAGFPLDAAHLATWLDFSLGDALPTPAHLATLRRVVADAELVCLAECLGDAVTWHTARVGTSLLLLASDDADRSDLLNRARPMLERIVLRLAGGAASLFVGMGSAHRGLDGLRRSGVEARAAADLGRQSRRESRITTLDATGMGRVLVELWTSPLSRRIVTELLAPLDEHAGPRAGVLLRTLLVYLDQQCSPKRAAAILHLHPNAVAYRIRQIEELLKVDLKDSDARFGVHLACRMRSLGRPMDAASER